MDILIPDEWLRNFLKTKATPKQIGEYLSLSGPSVEKVEKKGKTYLYHIEVTTNRVDTASVYGIAREAHAILPRFGIKTSLAQVNPKLKLRFVPKVKYLQAQVDQTLCPRFAAALIKNVKIKNSPFWLEERLKWVGVRPINNIVDISNYIMHEIGQPVHTFDYDKIANQKMIVRKSRRGEKFTTLDGKTHKLPGGDIVIADGKRLIDLAGIMGGQNSAVDKNTKNVLLFVQTYNPVNIRQTSMALAKRTEAAVLFEKGLDPENVTLGINRALELFEKLTDGKAEKEILDLYPQPYIPKKLTTSLGFINQRLGVILKKGQINSFLKLLGFEVKWQKDILTIAIPSFRASDINLPEDILEEVARIYGYHNLKSGLLQGEIPESALDTPFKFEVQTKVYLAGWGGTEVYNLSLVPEANPKALKLKNPLGQDSATLRTSFLDSLVTTAKANSNTKEPFHLFEMANVYLPAGRQAYPHLPEEKMTLAGIFSGYSFREAKGIIEALFLKLNFNYQEEIEDKNKFLPSQRIVIKVDQERIGEFGQLTNGFIFYELEIEKLRAHARKFAAYKPLPKYPAQIEDLTLILPAKTKVAELISTLEQEKFIAQTKLEEIFKNAYTLRVWYQDPTKTLTNEEVEKIRKRILEKLNQKFGAILKD